MHIPDGFISLKVSVLFFGISFSALGIAIRKINKNISENHIPLLGVLSSFIFAAQMLNFPVAGGTSGHFMGGILASVLLGPMTGLLILTTVLIVQCLIFQDGGLTALGANIFNMGIIGSVLGYYIFKGLNKIAGFLLSAFISAWISIMLAASFCAFELSLSNTVLLKVAFPAMASIHFFIGIGEGLITITALSFIFKVKPELLKLNKI